MERARLAAALEQSAASRWESMLSVSKVDIQSLPQFAGKPGDFSRARHFLVPFSAIDCNRVQFDAATPQKEGPQAAKTSAYIIHAIRHGVHFSHVQLAGFLGSSRFTFPRTN
jgi:hypothetical protein